MRLLLSRLKPRVGWLRWLRHLAWRLALWFFGLSVGFTLLYRFYRYLLRP